MTQEQIAESYKKKITRFKFDATENGITTNTGFDVDKNAVYITGFQLGSNNPAAVYFRGTLSLTIGGDVIFQDIPAQLFVTASSVEVEGRKYPLGEVVPGNGKVEVIYKDENNALQPFSGGYQVWLTVEYLIAKQK